MKYSRFRIKLRDKFSAICRQSVVTAYPVSSPGTVCRKSVQQTPFKVDCKSDRPVTVTQVEVAPLLMFGHFWPSRPTRRVDPLQCIHTLETVDRNRSGPTFKMAVSLTSRHLAMLAITITFTWHMDTPGILRHHSIFRPLLFCPTRPYIKPRLVPTLASTTLV